MSTTTIAQFRGDFPEFADTAAYPNSQVQMYLNLAELRLDQARWDALWQYGVELYTAHSLALAKQRAAAIAAGGVPGGTAGVVTSESVGGVSYSSDVSIVTTPGAGTYNLTSYGSEYWQLVLQIGIGGIQLGADYGGAGPGDSALGSLGVIPFTPFGY